jgi:hypothetical protein
MSFFIIFGSPRSGTTLLAQCLNLHSEILVPFETDIIVPIAFIVERVKDESVGKSLITEMTCNSYYFNESIGEYLTKDEAASAIQNAEYTLPAIITNLYTAVGGKAGKKLCGDKSPNDLHNVPILQNHGLLHEPTRVIHIVRDVRDTFFSLMRLKWLPGDDNGRVYARAWSADNLFLYDVYQATKQPYFFLRYEDLVSEPKKWLERLCLFLGVEFESRMLDTSSFHQRYKGVAAHSHLYDIISTKRIGQWKTQITDEQLALYEPQAREALLRFGYI